MKVAREVFFEEGYAAASMSTIAARLGGSKGTLYNYFKSKEELFAAYVADSCNQVAEDAFAHGLRDDRPVEEVLQELGEKLLAHIYSDWSVNNFRVIVTESKRAPELAQVFYAAGPAVGRERLAAYFERAVRRGALSITDYGRAAEHFLGLCRGDLHFRIVLNLIPSPGPEVIRADVASAIKVFMAAYGVAASPSPG
ncbi:MAG TPA: TetR/AcrR family transcriptional regulator [Caulobacteraceae bacterium]